jgi:hypothetical protein
LFVESHELRQITIAKAYALLDELLYFPGCEDQTRAEFRASLGQFIAEMRALEFSSARARFEPSFSIGYHPL